jgi:hypothetical protein
MERIICIRKGRNVYRAVFVSLRPGGYEPFTIFAIIAMAIAAATTAVSYAQQSSQQKKMGEYNRQVAENQAKQARIEQEWSEYNMRLKQQQSDIKARRLTEDTARRVAAIRTAKGIDSASPSLLIMEQEAVSDYLYDSALLQWDTDIEKKNIKREAYKYGYQAETLESEGAFASWQGTALSRNSNTKAIGSLLSGASDVGSYGYQANKPKIKTT